MAVLRIPEHYRDAYEAFTSLDEGESERLVSALSAVEGGTPIKTIAQTLSSKIPSIDRDEARVLIPAIEYLYRMMSYQDVSVEEMSYSLAASLVENEPGESFDDRMESLQERIQRILTIPSISKRAKRRELISETERKFCSIRIVTDVRPIFGDNVNETPEDLAIVHMAHLRYHEGPTLKDLFMSLDRSDMNDIQEAIDRARSKEQTIQILLQQVGAKPEGMPVEGE